MDLLKDLLMSVLNFSFSMIYITHDLHFHDLHKMLVLLKNHLNFLKVVFSNAFLRSLLDFYLFFS